VKNTNPPYSTPARNAASAAMTELIPQILTETDMGWGLWSAGQVKSSKPETFV